MASLCMMTKGILENVRPPYSCRIIQLERKVDTFPEHLRGYRQGLNSEIHHSYTKRFYRNRDGALSIKLSFGGPTMYSAGSARYLLEESRYLVLNEGQRYEVTIDADKSIESFAVIFKDGMANDALRTSRDHTRKLLDSPWTHSGPGVQLFAKTYALQGAVARSMLYLRGATIDGASDDFWFEERLVELLSKLLRSQSKVRQDLDSLSTTRFSTRVELYRRLHLAREFIRASVTEPIELDDIAAVACLSKTHLLRAFKAHFKTSPHQYLLLLKVDRAKRELRESDRTISELCELLNYSSLGSFSSLFRRRVGCTPSSYRLSKR